MEKEGFKKVMSKVKSKCITPKQVTTDRHTGIRKQMREQETEMIHQFDIWHLVKSLKKHLRAAAKKASCKIIEKWIKSIGNHLWWLTKKEQKAKEWIKPNTEAFTVLQSILLEPKLLSELKFLTKFSHTGILEVYHSLYNRWAPKRQHFSYSGMFARSQLAIMDFNQGSELGQAKTKDGNDRFDIISSKITNNWTA
ncbi:uncharacterized protein [Clytia hemisphaerica]|uniref:uncharacterized protein n=1 Tax=Clytia hemisphaerica TaxID=252671 RepID=UPI0034D3E3E3